MFHSLLARLRKDPAAQGDLTVDWPRQSTVAPGIDTVGGKLGPVKFGTNLDSARFFGRPDQFSWTQRGYCELIYAKAGFQIDYDSGQLGYAAFFIGPDLLLPAGVFFSAPTLDSSFRLSSDTSLAQVNSAIGPPKSQDRDDEEAITVYEKGILTLELEWNPKGKLKRLNVYPTHKA